MNKLLSIIQNRNSHRTLVEPHPSTIEMEEIYKAALRAPDHAWLKPSNFIEIKGDGLNKLSDIFEEFASQVLHINDENILQKYKNAPFRAPMIITLVAKLSNHPKVPYIEQKLSTAAAGQNILNALECLGYSGMWRTGKLAFNQDLVKMMGLDKNNEIIGFLYIGTKSGKEKRLPERNIRDHLTIWD
ncbi:nitroreductase [Gammaproteobacteria bacterium]|nr:nitroreductase [Gammaproteobacteria bacterium]